MAIRLIVDSASDLSEKEAKDLGVELVSLTVKFGEELYHDGRDISKDEFYKLVEERDDFPQTGAPSPEDFQKEFQKIKEAGDKAICITMTSDASATYQSAMLAVQDGYEDIIHVLDSKTASLGERAFIEYALRKIEEGLEYDKLIKLLEEKRDDAHIFAYVDTLEYVQKGGRVSKLAGLIGGFLKIKPILGVTTEGKIEIFEKARGKKAGLQKLDKFLEEHGGYKAKKLFISYSGTNKENMESFLETYKDKIDNSILDKSQLGITIGTHAGPGTVCVAFVEE